MTRDNGQKIANPEGASVPLQHPSQAPATSKLVEAVDQVIRMHDAWVDDETQNVNVPPQELLETCETLFGVARRADIIPGADASFWRPSRNFKKPATLTPTGWKPPAAVSLPRISGPRCGP